MAEQDWTLDGLGNWTDFIEKANGTTTLDQDRVHNSVNEIDNDDNHANSPSNTITAATGPNWVDPEYDAAGNTTKCPQPKYPTSSFTLTWDAWNRLVKVQDGGEEIATYEYDGLHRRIVKDSGADEFHYYYNTDWQVLEVRKGSETGTKIEQNVWHPNYIDALAVRYYDGNADGDYLDANETEFAAHDANFNVTALVDANGNLIERYDYDAYGKLSVLDGDFGDDANGVSDVANEYTFTGRRFDSETGLYYYRNQYYERAVGEVYFT